jgi:hypothetical protein
MSHASSRTRTPATNFDTRVMFAARNQSASYVQPDGDAQWSLMTAAARRLDSSSQRVKSAMQVLVHAQRTVHSEL